MMRSISRSDTPAILDIAVAAGLFTADETAALAGVLADYFEGNLDDGHMWLVEEEDGKSSGVIYYAPELMADRTWYIYMVAVRPELQGKGRGTRLMQQVENALTTSGERILIVETSSLPKYERTHAFYLKCGYEREARIRDFYTAGEDKIIFRKVLNVS